MKTAVASHDVSARLTGYFEPGFTHDSKVVIDAVGKEPTPGLMRPEDIPPVTIRDARPLQAQENDGSPTFLGRFFDTHGFVLLQHESQVENWDSGTFDNQAGYSEEMANLFGKTREEIQAEARAQSRKTTENEIATKYCLEIEDIIKNVLLPGKNLRVTRPEYLLRRGPGTANPFYGITVHNDYGLTADDFADNAQAFSGEAGAKGFLEEYERDDVEGYIMINFWRVVFMDAPLERTPFSVCDPQSIEIDDVISSGLKNFSPTGQITNQSSLRFNPNQKWYYYSKMRTNEVMTFKNFYCSKSQTERELKTCYHSAFENPNASPNAQERQSCEYRVGVSILRD